MKYPELRKQIIDACLWLQEKELVVGTWGNISVRTEEGILVTPSRVEYSKMTPEDMVLIDCDGRILEGARSPTRSGRCTG